MPTSILSDKEVRDRLGVSKATLHRLREEGQLGYYRLAARRIGYSEKHIEEFLRRAERPADE